MQTLKHNKLILRVYDSIDELPLIRFQAFNKFMLIDSGVGSDLNEITARINKIKALIDNDTNKAKQELENIKTSMFLISENISPKYLAFTAWIHSVNGKEVVDFSDDKCKRLLNEINTIPVGLIDRWISLLKKKLKPK